MKPGACFWWLGVVLPIAFFVGHFVAMAVMLPEPPHWYASEQSPHELGAGALFLAAGLAAIRLFLRHGPAMPKGPRWLWLIFAVGTLFIGLEEISYGQHVFGWRSPAYFDRVNIQHETNLHNLGGQGPQRTMRVIAEFGLPIWCLVLPVACMIRSHVAYKPGHWTRYLAPRWELAATVALAISLRPLRDWHPVILADKANKEFMEFLWGWAALLLVAVIGGRLRSSTSPPAEACCQ